MRRRTAALLAALALAAAGCGGDDDEGGSSDEDKVKTVVEDYAAAVADSDQPKACELLTDQVKSELEQDTGKQCQSYVTNLASSGSGQEIDKVEVSEVKVEGSHAVAKTKGVGGIDLEIDLIKQGVEWKISDDDDADLGTELTP